MNKVEITGILNSDPRLINNDYGIMVITSIKINRPVGKGWFLYQVKAEGDNTSQLDGYGKGDEITLEGKLNAYSKKNGEEWGETIYQIIVDRVVPEMVNDPEEEEDDLF